MVTATERERSWLAAEPAVERVQLDEASWVDVVRSLIPRADADTVHDELVATVPWEQGRVFRYERWVDMPRLEGHQSGSGRHPALVEVEQWISRRYRVRFDGVALAQYRSERDGVGFHRDRELRWLEDTVIGAFTLGARRPWLVKPLTGRRGDPEDELAGAIDLLTGQRRLARDGRAMPGGVAPLGPEGAPPRPQPGVRAVALDVETRRAGSQPVVLRAASLQPAGLTGTRQRGDRYS